MSFAERFIPPISGAVTLGAMLIFHACTAAQGKVVETAIATVVCDLASVFTPDGALVGELCTDIARAVEQNIATASPPSPTSDAGAPASRSPRHVYAVGTPAGSVVELNCALPPLAVGGAGRSPAERVCGEYVTLARGRAAAMGKR